MSKLFNLLNWYTEFFSSKLGGPQDIGVNNPFTLKEIWKLMIELMIHL
jgi:hypothetical protein